MCAGAVARYGSRVPRGRRGKEHAVARKHYVAADLKTVAQKIEYEAQEWRELARGSLPESACRPLDLVPSPMCASTLGPSNGIRLFQETTRRATRSLILHNAILEAFLLHFRCLAEFLLEKEDSGGAVRSFHFFPDNPHNWTDNLRDENLPLVEKQIDDWRHEASKHLAHLSAERVAHKHQWPVEEMEQKLLFLLSAFVKALPNERNAWFERVLSHLH
jgi:hypothetical protein